MRFYLPIWAILLGLVLSACGDTDPGTDNIPSEEASVGTTVPEQPRTPEEHFTSDLSKAHHAGEFHGHAAASFDIRLSFGGKERLVGTVTMLTNSTKVLVEREDGGKVLYDGKDVLMSPADAEWPRARFDVLTWAYFFAVPYKLQDPGTRWELLGRRPVRGTDSATAAKLTFVSGTGDAPDDWYILYANDSTGLLECMAYIVTFGKTSEESQEAEPHAIAYNDYGIVDGVPVAGRWNFTNWDMAEGISGERGEALISNIRFFDDTDGIFSLPEDALPVPLP